MTEAAPADGRGVVGRLALFLVTALAIFLADQATKSWVFSKFRLDPAQYQTIEQFHEDWGRRTSSERSIPLIDDKVRLVALLNSGMMWGKLAEHPNLLRVCRLLALLVVFYLERGLPARAVASRIALGAILGGALGNIADSLRFPGVRDFFEVDLGVAFFHPFPAFNVADSAICVGVAVLALGFLRPAKSPEQAQAPTAPA